MSQLPLFPTLTTHQRRILAALGSEHGGLLRHELESLTRLPARRVRRDLATLAERGLVRCVGGAGAWWDLTRDGRRRMR